MLDAVLSVDAVRLYKPRPGSLCDDHQAGSASRPAEVVFVSSNRWDVMGAARFGFRSALDQSPSNMPDEYPELPPLQIVTDLSAVASWIPA